MFGRMRLRKDKADEEFLTGFVVRDRCSTASVRTLVRVSGRWSGPELATLIPAIHVDREGISFGDSFISFKGYRYDLWSE